MQAEKLSREQIRELRGSLEENALANYELLWVLESCLETGPSAVYGLGAFPGAAGFISIHRNCAWLSLRNEMLLEPLLAQLPELDFHRFFTTSAATLAMLERWLPGGVLTQSSLWVRDLTRAWKKRFFVTVDSVRDPNTLGGWRHTVVSREGDRIAELSSQLVVPPWQEITEWTPLTNESYWLEQALGAVTAFLLATGSPVVFRAVGEENMEILAGLGYREFSKIFFYVAPGELSG